MTAASPQPVRHRPRFKVLPSPEVLSEYERLVPGTADRILKLAERSAEQRAARHDEYARLTNRTRRLRVALFVLTVCSALTEAVCVFVVAISHPRPGTGLLAAVATLPVWAALGYCSGYLGSKARRYREGFREGYLSVIARLTDAAADAEEPGKTP